MTRVFIASLGGEASAVIEACEKLGQRLTVELHPPRHGKATYIGAQVSIYATPAPRTEGEAP